MNQQIPGGGFIVARKLFESEIWIKPLIYLKVWVWILGHANHSDCEKYGRTYSKGELLTTYNKIIQAMGYHQNYKTIFPTIKQVRIILDWLQSQGMINVKAIRKNFPAGADPTADPTADLKARVGAYVGIKIVVVNYSTYQEFDNYKGRPQNRDKGRPMDRQVSQQGHDNKKEEECNITTLSSDKDNSIPFEEILEAYHTILPELTRVKVFSKERKGMLKARWSEDKDYRSIEWWRGYFEYVRKSDFLMGKKTDFIADFEWLITKRYFLRVREGKYNRN